MCGIFGIYGHKDAARLTYLGLYALQHRGEESAGIVTHDGRKVTNHKGLGLVGDVFDEKIIRSLRGDLAVGHVRYSTTGSSHPWFVACQFHPEFKSKPDKAHPLFRDFIKYSLKSKNNH